MQGLMIRVELPAVKNEASYLVDGGENSLQNSTANLGLAPRGGLYRVLCRKESFIKVFSVCSEAGLD